MRNSSGRSSHRLRCQGRGYGLSLCFSGDPYLRMLAG